MTLSRTVLGTRNINSPASEPFVLTTTADGPAGETRLVYVMGGNVGSTGATCADSAGGTYTTKYNPTNQSSSCAYVFECANAPHLASGGTISITWPSSFASAGIVCAESINAQTSPDDVNASTTGTGTAASSGSTATVAGSEEYVVTVFFAVKGATSSATLSGETAGGTAGFSQTANFGGASNAFQSLYTFYRDQNPASGTYSDSGTWSASVNWASATFVLKLVSTPTPITASASITPAPFTITSSAVERFNVSASITPAPFTISATVVETFNVSAGLTPAPFTISATVVTTFNISAAITPGPFTITSQAIVPVYVSAGVTPAPFTVTSSAVAPILSVSASVTPDPFTATATIGGLLISGALVPAPFTITSSLVVTPPQFPVAASITPGPFTLSTTIVVALRPSAVLTPGPFTITTVSGPVTAPFAPTITGLADPLAAAVSGAAGPVVLGATFEWRDLAYNFFADITNAVVIASVALDNYQPVSRTGKITLRAAELPAGFTASVASQMGVSITLEVLVGGAMTALPWGLFILDNPEIDYVPNGEVRWDANISDTSMALSYRTTLNPYTVASGTNYMAAVAAILDNFGLAHSLPTVAQTLPVDVTWPAQTAYLQIVDDVLYGLNYYPIWSDNSGILTTRLRVNPATLGSAVTYSTVNEPKMIHEGTPLRQGLDLTFANACSVSIDDPLRTAAFTQHTNTDPMSPLSTVTSGKSTLKDIKGGTSPSSKCVLDNTTAGQIAAFELYEANARAQYGRFATLFDPRRTNRELYTLDVDDVEHATPWLAGKWSVTIDPKSPGGVMQHEAGRVQGITLS